MTLIALRAPDWNPSMTDYQRLKSKLKLTHHSTQKRLASQRPSQLSIAFLKLVHRLSKLPSPQSSSQASQAQSNSMSITLSTVARSMLQLCSNRPLVYRVTRRKSRRLTISSVSGKSSNSRLGRQGTCRHSTNRYSKRRLYEVMKSSPTSER